MSSKIDPLNRRQLIIGAAALSLVGKSAAAPAEAMPPTITRRDLTKADIDSWMKELSNWGRWGKDDQAGTINLITPAKRRQAAALVKDGVSVSLSLDADIPLQGATDAVPEPGKRSRYTWEHVMMRDGQNMKQPSGYAVDSYKVTFHGNNTSHLDALSHFIFEGHIYNGFPADTITQWGATKNDVMPFKDGFLTRGILVDIPLLKGVSYMGDDEAVFPEDLEAWEKKAGLRIGSGDAVFLRTGRWLRVKEKGDLDLNVKAPGLYATCGKWLKDRDIAILGSDVVQDVRPSRVEGVNQPIHQMFLVAVGTPLFDNCILEQVSQEAAKRKRWEFMLTAASLRVPGGTGSPLNPIATF
jgi:kynurenine formamidase